RIQLEARARSSTRDVGELDVARGARGRRLLSRDLTADDLHRRLVAGGSACFGSGPTGPTAARGEREREDHRRGALDHWAPPSCCAGGGTTSSTVRFVGAKYCPATRRMSSLVTAR